MKKFYVACLLASICMTSGLTGCSYGGVAASGDKVVITRNDGFLFGVLRKVYVCKLNDGGLGKCKAAKKSP